VSKPEDLDTDASGLSETEIAQRRTHKKHKQERQANLLGIVLPVLCTSLTNIQISPLPRAVALVG
jgi:hypothetical protein